MRLGAGRGGSRRAVALTAGTDADLPLALLRPALELAWAVAVHGRVLGPPLPVPRPLRPLMHFSRLPERALVTVRQVVDDDQEFRDRVVAAADEAALGRVPWLWLARPDGWEEEIAVDAAARSQATAAAEVDAAERSAVRRLAETDAARQRAEAAAQAARRSAEQAMESAAAEAEGRRAADRRVAVLEAELAGMAGRAVEADDLVAALRAELSAARAALTVIQDERDQLAADLDRSRARQEELAEHLARAERLRAEADEVGLRTRSGVAAAVTDAAAAARRLGEALAAAASALDGQVTEPGGSGGVDRAGMAAMVPEGKSGPGLPGGARPAGPRGEGPVPRRRPGSGAVTRVRRSPVALPPAIFEDSFEAADHLLRVTGMRLLVDGYNVSKSLWSELPIDEQRRRLASALAELAARCGVEIHVVFDGAEQVGPPLPGAPRSAVRVRFSPPEVEADEVLIDMVDQLAPGVPVVVATSDRRVRDEVRARGANVISTPQLVAVLGRRR